MCRHTLPAIILPAFLALAPSIAAQTTDSARVPAPAPPPDGDVYDVADQMPTLLGGLEGIASRVVYPEEAALAGIEGRVFLQFVVDEEGVPQDVRVVRGIGGGCDEAAVAALQESRFEPGVQAGHPVKVRMALPIAFRLTQPPHRPTVVPPVVFSPPVQETDEVEARGSDIHELVEKMPELIGGIERLQARIAYPEGARRAGIEGRVFIQFVVDETGTVTDIHVVRGLDRSCNEAAVLAIHQSRFTPGMHEGRPVKVRMALPVTFRLN